MAVREDVTRVVTKPMDVKHLLIGLFDKLT